MVPTKGVGHEEQGDGGPAAPREPQYEIFECVYPDDRRRASGETADEAVSRAYFLTYEDADAFSRHNGGTVASCLVSATVKRQLQRSRLLPNAQPTFVPKRRAR